MTSRFGGGLRIDGQVHGNVIAAEGEPGTLVVSEQARIDGEIRVSHVVINGTVNGPVNVDDHLELQAKARVAGDVDLPHAGDARRRRASQGRLNHSEPGSASVVELKRAGGA